MKQAKAAGIDAFALNIGIDSYTNTQLNYAYQSAANIGMNVFISFDFNWFTTSQTSEIGQIIKTYGSQSAQLKVGGKIFVSSFKGDGLDLDAVASASGHSRTDLFFAPNFEPTNAGSADALFNWMAWPNNGDNKAPGSSNNLTVSDGDRTYISALAGKPYMASVSAWFSTHFGLEVSYSKNWVFPSDLLWFQRWTEILTLAPQFLEIISWNDWGESHYISSLGSPHLDDGNSKWTNDMPHDGFLQMAKPYISAFKAGSKTVDSYIKSDQLIYWYRPTLKSASCDSTDTCAKPWPSSTPNPNYFVGKPNGYETMEDSVFVIALLQSPGTVTVVSGSISQNLQRQRRPQCVPSSHGNWQTIFFPNAFRPNRPQRRQSQRHHQRLRLRHLQLQRLRRHPAGRTLRSPTSGRLEEFRSISLCNLPGHALPRHSPCSLRRRCHHRGYSCSVYFCRS